MNGFKLMISFLFFNFAVNGQPYFSKMYNLFGAWEGCMSVINYNQNEIILTGSTINFNANDSTKYTQIYTWKVDSSGQKTTILKVFGKEYYYYSGMYILKTPNSKIGVLGSDSLSCLNYFLLYFDSANNVKSTFEVEVNNKFNNSAILKSGNRIYFFGRDIKNTTIKPPLAVLCTDTLGKQLWYKVYQGKRSYPTGVAETEDNNFIIGGVASVSDGPLKDSTFAWFAKIDTLGNFIWEKKLPFKNEYVSNIIPLNINKNYYYFGGYGGSKNVNLTIAPYTYLYKTDLNGNILDYKIVQTGFASRFNNMYCGYIDILFQNNFIYAAGVVTDTFSINKYNDYIQFCKIDTLGNIKWRRLFKQWYKDNRAFSLTAIPDGFIICADGKDTTHATGFTDAWIIKIDTNGCIIPGCHLSDGIVEVLDASNYVKVFPNPANTEISILFNDPNKTKIDWVELIDSQGQSLQTFLGNNNYCNFSTSNFPNGIYYLAAYFNGKQRIVKKILVQHE
jgi:hypothetical protein